MKNQKHQTAPAIAMIDDVNGGLLPLCGSLESRK